MTRRLLASAVALLLAAGLTVALTASTPTPATHTAPTTTEAVAACERLLLDRMARPELAAIVDSTGRADDLNRWTVTGLIDGADSEGYIVRAAFECGVRHDDSWTLTALHLTPAPEPTLDPGTAR